MTDIPSARCRVVNSSSIDKADFTGLANAGLDQFWNREILNIATDFDEDCVYVSCGQTAASRVITVLDLALLSVVQSSSTSNQLLSEYATRTRTNS